MSRLPPRPTLPYRPAPTVPPYPTASSSTFFFPALPCPASSPMNGNQSSSPSFPPTYPCAPEYAMRDDPARLPALAPIHPAPSIHPCTQPNPFIHQSHRRPGTITDNAKTNEPARNQPLRYCGRPGAIGRVIGRAGASKIPNPISRHATGPAGSGRSSSVATSTALPSTCIQSGTTG